MQKPSSSSAMDEQVQEAMRVLSLQVDFTQEQLRKNFYRVSLKHHPDKGGSEETMKEVVNARDVCEEYLARQTTNTNLSPDTDSFDSAEEFAAPWSPPSEDFIQSVVVEATTFVTLLGECSNGKMLRGELRSVLNNRSMMKRVCRFAFDCTSLMVRAQATPRKSWPQSGFKLLSYQGYDTRHHGLIIVDYGNYEYLALLEFLCLQDAAIWENLNILRKSWPTKLDLWKTHKSLKHVERLGDVIEIIMGGLRGENWFKGWTVEEANPQLFAYFCSLGKLIHLLDARLKSGRLKWKNERIQTLQNKGKYQEMWRNGDMAKGVLLAALSRAIIRESFL